MSLMHKTTREIEREWQEAIADRASFVARRSRGRDRVMYGMASTIATLLLVVAVLGWKLAACCLGAGN